MNNNYKKCNKCDQLKNFSDFCFRNKSKNILHSTCKVCINIYAENYRDKNKEIISEKHKKWTENNSEYLKEYRKENKEHINKISRKKYAEDPEYRIKKILRTRFNKTVKEKKKYSKILNYIGVSLEYFKKWIEFQFQNDNNMTWENQGKYWDFDHVKPCASFDLTKEEEIQKCFIWYNISPLEKKKNYVKNKKVDPILIENTIKLKNKFISLYPVPSLNSDI
jgi:hypothetical protein